MQLFKAFNMWCSIVLRKDWAPFEFPLVLLGVRSGSCHCLHFMWGAVPHQQYQGITQDRRALQAPQLLASVCGVVSVLDEMVIGLLGWPGPHCFLDLWRHLHFWGKRGREKKVLTQCLPNFRLRIKIYPDPDHPHHHLLVRLACLPGFLLRSLPPSISAQQPEWSCLRCDHIKMWIRTHHPSVQNSAAAPCLPWSKSQSLQDVQIAPPWSNEAHLLLSWNTSGPLLPQGCAFRPESSSPGRLHGWVLTSRSFSPPSPSPSQRDPPLTVLCWWPSLFPAPRFSDLSYPAIFSFHGVKYYVLWF